MNEEGNHEQTRLALEKLRIEGDLRIREAELALKREQLQKEKTVALLFAVLIAVLIGLFGAALGVILLQRINKANKPPQVSPSAEVLTIEPVALQDPRIIADTRRLAEYFRKHGSNSVNGILHVKVVTNMPPGFETYISHYTAGTTYILPDYFRDPDVLFKEYAHLVLLSDEAHIRMSDEDTDIFDIEDGLTTYFPCSFNNHAVWGEASAQNKALHFDGSDLNNTYTFAASIQDRSLIWGGIFWELRERLGRDTADTLLVGAWQSLQPSDISSGAQKAFVDNIIKQDQLSQWGQHVSIIQSIFQKRKLKMY